MDFPIFPFAPRSPLAIPVEVQRLTADNPIRRIPPHGHLFFELIMITDGAGLIMVDGSVHTALPGCVFMIAPGMPHDARGLASAAGWTVMFTAAGATPSPLPGLALFEDAPAGLVFDPFRRTARRAGAPLLLAAADMAALVALIERIEAELTARPAGYDIAVRAALNLAMVQLGRAATAPPDTQSTTPATTPAGAPPDAAPQGRDLLARVFEDIDLHFAADASLAAGARRLGIAPAHLTTRIRRLTGKTYGGWVIERRMIEARHLLATTPRSLAAIATTVGYRDTESFIRRFRARHGLPPAQWRSQARGAAPEPEQRGPERESAPSES
ncbi:AraC family transcriptional regulator [Acidiphilium sp. C61]|jgi:AraC-like DNA-binding protein|uniref:AraC family transcriptional regulator n=1 Tax=Acidiphilium sp. C61 TaxID=1671485 RepID=UPI00157AC344|nr:AraC family transcriptional regulator [Acidiphilium sp. C61]